MKKKIHKILSDVTFYEERLEAFFTMLFCYYLSQIKTFFNYLKVRRMQMKR